MYKISFTKYEIPEKEAKLNVILFLSWFFITIITFILSFFINYILLLVFLIELILIIPILIFIIKRSDKLTKKVTKTINLKVKDNNLYYNKHIYYVEEKNNIIKLVRVANYNKYRIGIKIEEIQLEENNNEEFIKFCKDNNIKINDKKYLI